MSSDHWRLLDTGLADGATNMAMDEAILHACAQGEVPPTLRLYGWSPHCLSIGYFQNASKEVKLEECRRLGIDVVRRLTGGRAVLHSSELTYSVAIPARHSLAAGRIVESYRRISLGLVAGLAMLGLEVETAPGGASRRNHVHSDLPNLIGTARTSSCFDLPSDYEITVHGRKLVGSAQTRKRGALLQHGSVLLEFDPAETAAVLYTPFTTEDQFATILSSRVISLREALNRTVSYGELANAVKTGFERALGITLERGRLTEAETALANELRLAKYARDEWNLRR